MFAVLAVLIMTAVAFVPLFDQADSASSSGGYWTYTVTSDGKVTGSGSALPSPGKFTAPVQAGSYGRSTDGYSTGDWGFDSKGCGPFGSFYAAFDACHGNKILCHLDPNDLTQSIDKVALSTGYKDHTINIMWVLPTIYWSVDKNTGDLILSNDPSKGTAYAHTIDGDVHEYLAIGVYEASYTTIGGKIVLTSTTGTKPLNDAHKPGNESMDRAHFRTYANNNTVATEDGTTVTGHAMLWNLYAWQLYRFSVLTVGGGWDSQGIFGNGDVYNAYSLGGGHTGYSANTTGALDKSGPYAGSFSYSESVKVFIENAWGSLDDFVDGVLFYKDDNRQIKMYATQSSKPTDSSSDYSTVVGVLPSGDYYGPSTSSEYPAYWGLHVDTWTGHWNERYKEGLYDGLSTGGGGTFSEPNGLDVGGFSYSYGSIIERSGLSYMDASDSVGYSSSSTGGRLAFVFGADPAAPAPEVKVTYNHDDLRALLKQYGYKEDLADNLLKQPRGKENYDKLKDVEGFRHVGWIVDGVQCAAESRFLKTTDHEARSVWVGLPAVTYDHSELIRLTGDQYSTLGLSNAIEIPGHDGYEQLPDRDGYEHTGWRIAYGGKEYEVGPADGFVTRNSHTAVSLWKEIPTVTFDHSQLTNIVGTDGEGVSDLQTSMTIEGNGNYPQLPNTAGYRHTGWEIDGKTVAPTAGLVSEKTHNARSLWEKIPDSGSFRPIPIIPDDTDPVDPGATVPVVTQGNSEPWLGEDGKTILLLAIVVAIIAELAVLCISRRR